MWAGRAQSRRRCGRGEPSRGSDVAAVSAVPAQAWQGASPVPAQMWAGRAQSRFRCGRRELRPGADVASRARACACTRAAGRTRLPRRISDGIAAMRSREAERPRVRELAAAHARTRRRRAHARASGAGQTLVTVRRIVAREPIARGFRKPDGVVRAVLSRERLERPSGGFATAWRACACVREACVHAFLCER